MATEPGSFATDGGSFGAPLWRALAVFRVAALAYALILLYHNDHVYAHPVAAWAVGGVITVWTVVTIYCYARPSRRGWPLLVADLIVMGGCLLVSVPIIGLLSLHSTRTLPGIAVAGTVMAWAIYGGRWVGAIAAILIGVADLSTRGKVDQNTLNSVVLLLLAAVAIGHMARLGLTAEERLARAVELEAATRTRERLARNIHDSVLQALAIVARRADEIGGETVELGQLAREQEAVLRTLISSAGPSARPDVIGPGAADLCIALDRYASRTVTIVAPATAVGLPERILDELVAAVGSALDNVRHHAGDEARAWVLVEDGPDAVTITVRDDGPGIAPGRLEQAAADGRLGVAQSISGRIRDLGGAALISSIPGHGTEVELRVPRARR